MMAQLLDAVKSGDYGKTRRLLQEGCDVNATVQNGYHRGTSALYWATCQGHVKIFDLLLQHGADVNQCDDYGNSPLHAAADQGKLHIVQILLMRCRGANPCLANLTGDTPLHLAAYRGHIEICHMLVSHGAKITAPNNLGRTPLHESQSTGHINVSMFLSRHLQHPVENKREIHTQVHTRSKVVDHKSPLGATEPISFGNKQEKFSEDQNKYTNVSYSDFQIPTAWNNRPAPKQERSKGQWRYVPEECDSGSPTQVRRVDETHFGQNTDDFSSGTNYDISTRVRDTLTKENGNTRQPSRALTDNNDRLVQELQENLRAMEKKLDDLTDYTEKLQVELTKRDDELEMLRKDRLLSDKRKKEFSSLVTDLTLKNGQLQKYKKRVSDLEHDVCELKKQLDNIKSENNILNQTIIQFQESSIELNASVGVESDKNRLSSFETSPMQISPNSAYVSLGSSITLDSYCTSGSGYIAFSKSHISSEVSTNMNYKSYLKDVELFIKSFTQVLTGQTKYIQHFSEAFKCWINTNCLVDASSELFALDNVKTSWCLGEDFDIIGDKISNSRDSSTVCCLEFIIVRKSVQYSLQTVFSEEYENQSSLKGSFPSYIKLMQTLPSHPNVDRILHEFDLKEDDLAFREHIASITQKKAPASIPCIVMAYYPVSLKASWENFTSTSFADTKLSATKLYLTQIIYQLASALDFLSVHDVAHRNISAESVMVDANYRLVLTGFTMALRLREGDGSDIHLTDKSQVHAGNSGAWAPELLALRKCNDLKAQQLTLRQTYRASDLYAMGRMVLHLLAIRPTSSEWPSPSLSSRDFAGESPMQSLWNTSHCLGAIVNSIVQPNPVLRFSAKKIKISCGMELDSPDTRHGFKDVDHYETWQIERMVRCIAYTACGLPSGCEYFGRDWEHYMRIEPAMLEARQRLLADFIVSASFSDVQATFQQLEPYLKCEH